METVQIIALTMGTAWASGINLYATIFMLGVLGGNGYVTLPAELELVTDPLVIIAAGFMYCIEFFADKIPGIDTTWDSIHTFIRIPAGAILAMAAIGDTNQAVELAAFIVGGTLAGATHATKMSTRILLNTSPEPVTNWTASFTEDFLVIIGIWTALNHPWIFLIALVIFIGIMIWILPRIWQTIKTIARNIRNMFAKQDEINTTS